MIRIGILGAAKIAPRAILGPVRERRDAEVICVAAREPARAIAYAAEHSIPHVAASYAELIARDDVDLVYVALPAAAHAQWSIRALKAGKAVLCEKPFCLDAAEAEAMVAASAKAQRPLIEAYHYRHHPVMVETLRLLRSGAIGRVVAASAGFGVRIPYHPDELRWRADQGGGALGDLGCYAVHALRITLEAEPTVAAAAAVLEHGVDASTTADLRFPSGLVAPIACSMTAEAFSATLRLEGEAGALEVANYVAPQIGCRFTLERGGVRTELPVDRRPTFAWQFDHIAAVMAGEAAPLTGAADAIATMRVLDAIRGRVSRSAAEGAR